MTDFLRDNWKYLLPALVLHIAIGVALTLNIKASSQRVAPSQLAIQARVVDQSAIRRVRERERQVAEQRQEKERAEQEAREREANEKREREAEAERQKVEAEQKAQQLAADIKKREAAAAAATAARKQADKQRVAEVQRKQREQADKRRVEQESKAQAQREAELKRQLAEEEGRMQAVNSGQLSEYYALIKQRIERNWTQPASAKRGLECDITVAQAPGGTVLSVKIGKCNGDAAVQQSIEQAVYKSSPLPQPPDSRLFERQLTMRFKPLD